jgi:hypothetical protein
MTVSQHAVVSDNRGKRLRLLAVALPLVLLLVVIGAWGFWPSPSLEALIRAAGFEPLNPPTRLREPGALYYVEADESYVKVCDPDPVHLERVIKESAAPDRSMQRLTKGSFGVTGKLAESLSAALGGLHGVSVTYNLTDVKVKEVAMNHLHDLQATMLSDHTCAAVVRALLQMQRRVCMGRQTLRATTLYKVSTDSAVGLDAQGKSKLADIAHDTISQHVGGKGVARTQDETIGRDLAYGIRLNSLCVTLPDATQPILAPQPSATARLTAKS